MIKADKYYIDNLNRIVKEDGDGTWDENPRPKYIDGQPGHSKFITQIFEEYDLSKGEFPITTLRNTAIKTGIREILWIYQKQSNSLEVAREMGINWWDEWNVGDGTIGQRYGATVQRYDLMNKLLKSLKKELMKKAEGDKKLSAADSWAVQSIPSGLVITRLPVPLVATATKSPLP